MKNSFCIIGGDTRNRFLKDLLLADNQEVFDYDEAEDLCTITSQFKYIIGPTPFSKDNQNLFSTNSKNNISLEKLINSLTKDNILFGGGINQMVTTLLINQNINFIDLLAKKEVAILNAIPTVEGALKLAIESTDFTIHNSRSLVIGYGNIGKILSNQLKNLGSSVTVTCRKNEDYSTIFANGPKPIYIDELDENLKNKDLIFNTVPNVLITEKNISNINENCTYIELASKPFGIDFDMAKKYGVKIIDGQSLPGKIAPKTAAIYIRDTIYKEIKSI